MVVHVKTQPRSGARRPPSARADPAPGAPIGEHERLYATLLLRWSRTIGDHRTSFDAWLSAARRRGAGPGRPVSERGATPEPAR